MMVMILTLTISIHSLRVSDQNGVSVLYIMLEIHHSGREPLIFSFHCHHVYTRSLQQGKEREREREREQTGTDRQMDRQTD